MDSNISFLFFQGPAKSVHYEQVEGNNTVLT
jgi:hypothetical protein